MLRPLMFVLLLLSLHGSSAFTQTLSGENSQIMIAAHRQKKSRNTIQIALVATTRHKG